MAVTRKALAAMGIEAEKIDQIIEMHTETVQALKEERDTAKEEARQAREDAGKIPDMQKELEDLKAESAKGAALQEKYDSLKKEYDEYKSAQVAAKVKRDREAAARAYFKEHKITGEDNLEIVMRGSRDEIGALELDNDGNIKDTKALDALVAGVYSKFVATEGVRGAETSTPPANNGGDVQQPSRAAQLVRQYRAEHYGSKED